MPPLTDEIIRRQLARVLANWQVTGYVTAKALVLEWIAEELPGIALKDLARALNAHLLRGAAIDQVPEHRPEWSIWPYHYDFRLRLAERDLYIETILQDDDPRDPTIHIVSIHDA